MNLEKKFTENAIFIIGIAYVVIAVLVVSTIVIAIYIQSKKV